MRLPARLRLARKRGVRAGRGVALGRGVRLEVAPGARLVLGDRCEIGERTRIVVNHGRVVVGAVADAHPRVGDDARLDEGAALVDFDHVFADVERPIRAQPLEAAAVTICDGARIGLGASVLRGVTVGAGAVVGPHAVVTRDVPPRASVEGVPARPV